MRWETWGEASLVTLNQAEVEDYKDTHSSKQEREQMHFSMFKGFHLSDLIYLILVQLNKVRMTLLSFFGFIAYAVNTRVMSLINSCLFMFLIICQNFIVIIISSTFTQTNEANVAKLYAGCFQTDSFLSNFNIVGILLIITRIFILHIIKHIILNTIKLS
jgi:hypothetical protein